MVKDIVLNIKAELADLETQSDFEQKAQYDAGYAKGLADGKAGGDADAKIYSQAEADKLVSDALAALPADTTPFAQSDIDAAVATATAAMSQTISDMKLADAQKDTLEEAIAAQMKDLADKVSALTPTAPVADAPVAAPAV